MTLVPNKQSLYTVMCKTGFAYYFYYIICNNLEIIYFILRAKHSHRRLMFLVDAFLVN